MENEPKRLSYIEKKIDGLSRQVGTLEVHFNALIHNVFGNKDLDAGDNGVVGQIKNDVEALKRGHQEIRDDVKKEFGEVKAELQKNKLTQVKYNVWMTILWIAVGAVAMAVFNEILRNIHFK